jgi:hypothetical protein
MPLIRVYHNYLFFIVNAVIMLTAYYFVNAAVSEKKSKVLIPVFIIFWIVSRLFVRIRKQNKSIVSYSDNFGMNSSTSRD